jgi:5-methylcytosine-specific restriction endonuclease McrA
MSVLLLNFSYEPLGIVDLRRAVRLLFARKVEIVHRTGETIQSTSIAFPLPSVLRMLYYVRRSRKRVALTKKNVLLRDGHVCAYCSAHGGNDMTVDHVVPRSRRGQSVWENLVACCMTCNARKGSRTPDEARMPLRRKPREPRYIPFAVIRRNTAHDEWGKYLALYNVGIEERVTS